MSASLSELEREIEESRARLDRTIDRIQDRLSPVGLVDEMLGSARRTPGMSDLYDGALESVRRNPVPVLLIAAGVGLLLRNVAARSRAVAARRSVPDTAAAAVPVVDRTLEPSNDPRGSAERPRPPGHDGASD